MATRTRRRVYRWLLAVFVSAGIVSLGGVLETSGIGPADAIGLRRLRIQKVTNAATHPAHDFVILVGPALPGVPTRLEENSTTGQVVELVVPETELWVAEGPQQGGWQRGGYAAVPDPEGTAQCSPNLSFGPDYSQIIIPSGHASYLVCVRNTYQLPDVALTSLVLLSSSTTTANYSFEITNTGPTSLDPHTWKIESWASPDGTLDVGADLAAGDRFLDGATPLNPGAKFSGEFAATLQGSTFLTMRFLIVRVVTGFPESNPANNIMAVPIPIGPVYRAVIPFVATSGVQ